MASKIKAHRLIINRKSAGLSQIGAANLLGVTPTQLMEWELGKRIPSLKHLVRLEALYHRLISDMYYELRQEALEVLAENKRKYGPDGLGIHKEKPT